MKGGKQIFKIVHWLQHTIVRDVATPPLATGSTLAANASPAPFAGASGEAEKEKVAVGLVRFKIV